MTVYWKGGDPRRTLHYLARVRLRAGDLCHRGRAECADSSTPLSKGRAVCGSSARTDLCGGRFVRIVPTATVNSSLSLSDKQDRVRIYSHIMLPCAAWGRR